MSYEKDTDSTHLSMMICTRARLARLAITAILLAMLLATTARAQAVDLASVPVVRLVEERRIGSHDDPNVGFSNIGSVAVDREGNVYAVDQQTMTIKVFSPDGQWLRAIGRRGQGPGEFQGLGRIGVKGDTLWAEDHGPSCSTPITLFTRDGTFISRSTVVGIPVLTRGNSRGFARPVIMLGDGRMLSGESICFAGASANGTRGGGPPASEVVIGPASARVPRIRFDLASGRADTVGWFTQVVPPSTPTRDTIIVEGRQVFNAPLPDEPLIESLRDGMITIERSTPRGTAGTTVRVIRGNLRGDTTASVSLRYAPVRFPGAVIDSFADLTARVYGPMRGMPWSNFDAARSTIRAGMKFPPFQPPVSSAFAGDDGSLWLRREDAGGSTMPWLVLDAQARPRGTVILPRRAWPAWASGSVLWAVVPDADDVPWLVRYRLER
jgi:hypothetical protein